MVLTQSKRNSSHTNFFFFNSMKTLSLLFIQFFYPDIRYTLFFIEALILALPANVVSFITCS